MKMRFKKKKLQSIFVAIIVLMIIITSGILVAGNSTAINQSITSAIIQIEEVINNTAEIIIEATSQIEVWANTFINIKKKQNSADISLSLDNGTALPNQEIEFYLDESLISSQLTDSEGYTELIFNPNTSPGTYSFRVEFQGNPNLYLNPSFAEEQIEIIGENEAEINETDINITIPILNETNQTFFNETNQSLLNQTLLNQTIELNISLDGMVCKEFTDNVLFSSGYTYKKKGSTNYETWEIQTNCAEAGGYDCSLHNINTKSRVLYVSPDDDDFTGEGYVQISELDNSACNAPENKEYSKYIAYDTPKEEDDKKWENYCGKNKNQDSKCDIESSDYYEESMCYGIKTYASQYSLVDVVEIKYTWCWKPGEKNES